MGEAPNDQEFRQRMGRLDALLQSLERVPDAPTRARLQEIVQAILDLHAAALERILERLADTGAAGLEVIDSLGKDDLVGSLLLLYGLHPFDCETRVRQALEQVRPLLHAHGGDVELLELTGNRLRLRMQGSCHGCPSSALTLKSAIQEAILARAPDVTIIEVEGVVAGSPPETNGHGRMPLPVLGS